MPVAWPQAAEAQPKQSARSIADCVGTLEGNRSSSSFGTFHAGGWGQCLQIAEHRGQQGVFRKIRRRKRPEKGLTAEHEDKIREVKKLLNFARQIDNCPASTSKSLELRVEFLLCTDVDATRRIIKNDDPGRDSKR